MKQGWVGMIATYIEMTTHDVIVMITKIYYDVTKEILQGIMVFPVYLYVYIA